MDWGDGTSDTQIVSAGTDYIVSHMWKVVGNYAMTAKIQDSNGTSFPSIFKVTVESIN